MGEIWDAMKEKFKQELAKDSRPALSGRGLMVGIETDDGTKQHFERVQYVVVGVGLDTFLLARVILVDGKPVLDVQSSFCVEPLREDDQ